MSLNIVLRELELADRTAIAEYLQDPVMHETTLNIPFPYTTEDADHYINKYGINGKANGTKALAISEDSGQLLGIINYTINDKFETANVGYWVGRKFWGLGVATKALGLIIDFLFTSTGTNVIWATHFVKNKASGRVMEKNHMCYEGTMRAVYKKDGRYIDAARYSILKKEWASLQK